MAEIKSSTHEDLEFDGVAMSSIFEDTDCWLVALDDWEIAVILSSLRYAHWPRRWRNLGSHTWAEIEAAICGLEYCLMAGCNVGELLNKFDTLNENLATLAGRFVTPEDKGIAEVVEDLELTCDTTVNFDTAAIVEAVEALELTCGDTEVNFDTAAIVEAIENLELVSNCAPDVNLSCSPDVIVNVGASGEGGIKLPSDPGTEGETPPTGWEEPPETTYDRKCRLANMFYDDLVQVLTDFDKYHVVETITLAPAVAIEVITAVLLLTGVIGLGIAIIGAVAGLILALAKELCDIPQLIEILEDNKEDLICTLYNSTDTLQAIEDFKQVLTDGGANTEQIGLVSAIFSVEAANALYFRLTGANGDALEAKLDGYEGSVGCGVCGGLLSLLYDFEGTLHGFETFLSGQSLSNPSGKCKPFTDGTETSPYYAWGVYFKNDVILPEGSYELTATVIDTPGWVYEQIILYSWDGVTLTWLGGTTNKGLVTFSFAIPSGGPYTFIVRLDCGSPATTLYTEIDHLNIVQIS
jgi:hypothetical protein